MATAMSILLASILTLQAHTVQALRAAENVNGTAQDIGKGKGPLCCCRKEATLLPESDVCALSEQGSRNYRDEHGTWRVHPYHANLVTCTGPKKCVSGYEKSRKNPQYLCKVSYQEAIRFDRRQEVCDWIPGTEDYYTKNGRCQFKQETKHVAALAFDISEGACVEPSPFTSKSGLMGMFTTTTYSCPPSTIKCDSCSKC